MIIVVSIISLVYIILLTLILIAYYRDTSDIELRILELEKRIGGDSMPCGRPKGRKSTSKGGGRRK